MPDYKYSIVIPVYNGAQSLPFLNQELEDVLGNIGEPYEIIYVDDCSADNSWHVLKEIKSDCTNVRIIRLAKNVGQFMAFHCGVSRSKGEHIVTIDDDLEYKTSDIKNLLDYYHRHDYLIVYGIPEDKQRKNLSYRLFFNIRNYILKKWLGKHKTESFRVFSRKIVFDKENNIFSSLHFEPYAKHTVSQRFVGYLKVDYQKRPYGKSGHTLLGKIEIILKFSKEYLNSPLKILIYTGIIVTLGFIFTSVAVLFWDLKFTGEFWLTLGGMFFGIVFLTLGILAYYLAQIFLILKGKPDYLVIEEL